MPSNRDLAEAHAYQRRRVVAALVTGRDDPEVVSGPGPVRALVVGCLLALLLLGVAAVEPFVRQALGQDPAGLEDPTTSVELRPAR